MVVNPLPTRHILLLLALWLAASLALGASGVLTSLQPPWPQVTLISITSLLIGISGSFASSRRWLFSVDLRCLVAIHLVRFIGFYVLYRYSLGELPYAFAVPGGIGDIIVALLAVILLLTTSPTSILGRRLYLIWNILGLLDIMSVVATADLQELWYPGSMQALLQLPLSLLLTFIVPLIIASHLVMLVRLWKTNTAG